MQGLRDAGLIEIEGSRVGFIHDHRAENVLASAQVELAMDRVCGALRIRSDAHLGDIVAMTHRGHRPVRAQQRIPDRCLRRFHEREHLLPRPVRLLERALAGEEIGQGLAKPRLAPREVLAGVVADLLQDQIVPGRIGYEGRIVLQHEIERVRVRLVFDQLGSVDVEDLDRETENGS